MKKHIEQFLLTAQSKALATLSHTGVINVVPVSTITVREGNIILVDYFMNKTRDNILAHPQVSIVAWSSMIGYQIKGKASYITSGTIFDEVCTWVHSTLPERIVQGIIIIQPQDFFDISPDKSSDATLEKNIA